MIDTHSHLFDEAFKDDLKDCVERCYIYIIYNLYGVIFLSKTWLIILHFIWNVASSEVELKAYFNLNRI